MRGLRRDARRRSTTNEMIQKRRNQESNDQIANTPKLLPTLEIPTRA
jgi:hypothetical protein